MEDFAKVSHILTPSTSLKTVEDHSELLSHSAIAPQSLIEPLVSISLEFCKGHSANGMAPSSSLISMTKYLQ